MHAPSRRSVSAFAVAALGCGLCVAASAGASDCAAVQLAPRAQRLSELLGELSAVHPFEVVNRHRVDPIVRHAGGSELEVMRSLAGQVNLIVRYQAVQNCPGLWRVETVQVLPREAAAPTVAKVARPLSPREEADAAAAKKAMGLYTQAHGRGAPAQRDAAASAASSAGAANRSQP